jgi:hypothetical protein
MTEPESSSDAPEPAASQPGSREPASPDQLLPSDQLSPPAAADGSGSPLRPDPSIPSMPWLLGKRKGVSPYTAHYARVSRRRDKIVAEIERNRRGEAAIPTWVLALILVVIVGGVAAIVVFS